MCVSVGMCVCGSFVCTEPVAVTREGESVDSKRKTITGKRNDDFFFHIYLLTFKTKPFGCVELSCSSVSFTVCAPMRTTTRHRSRQGYIWHYQIALDVYSHCV